MQIMQKTNFESFDKALMMTPEEVIDIIDQSGLKGRGGAHFPTGMKWKFTREAEGSPKYLICNFDEGEPGTFKDKFIIDNNPDLLLEGIAIASYAIGITKAYIYLRGEYEFVKKVLNDVIKKYADKLAKIGLEVVIFEGAGAYICGDETAIMNSIEGYRGEPRAKPPFPAQHGLWQCPTCINNVETLSNVPLVLKGGWQHMMLFSLSGNLTKPGVYELPIGAKAKELIEQGAPAKPIKALFMGCSGGCVPYDPEMVMDVETLANAGSMLGSGTVIAIDEDQSIPHVCHNIAEFFVHESCGKCNPCREGGVKVLELLDKVVANNYDNKDIDFLQLLADFLADASFCGLGQTAGKHIETALKYFGQEFKVK